MIEFTLLNGNYKFPCVPGFIDVYRRNPDWMFADIASHAFYNLSLSESDFPLDITVGGMTATVCIQHPPVFKVVDDVERAESGESVCSGEGVQLQLPL